jgi:hypothetical protein
MEGAAITAHNTTDLAETELVAEWQQPLPPGDHRRILGVQETFFHLRETNFSM